MNSTLNSQVAIEPGSWSAWLVALRPKTLWIAVVPVFVGTSLAVAETGQVNALIAFLALVASIKEALEQGGNEEGQLIRRTYQNVRRYEELRVEMQEQPMAAMRRTIGQSVDENFEVYRKHALDKTGSSTLRNWSFACLGFAIEKRVAARELLQSFLLDPDSPPWLLANACMALSVLKDKDTDLSVVIPLVGHGNPEVRANAATAIKEVWFVSETPRDLTPQYYAAIDRLVALLHDDATTRGRRAAVWSDAASV